MKKKIVIAAGILGMLAVILGAFGAHGLEKWVSDDQVAAFETGVRYQMYHALLLLFLGHTADLTDRSKRLVFYLIVSGTLLFSGSIYLLVTDVLLGIELSVLGPVTPLGGLTLLLGWFFLIRGVMIKS